MGKKLKYIISIALVFTFLTPMAIKLLDGIFHQHVQSYYTVKHETHFHEYHKKCPILCFELSIFAAEKTFQITHKLNFFVKQNSTYDFVCYCKNLQFIFLLRAPPNFTDKIIT